MARRPSGAARNDPFNTEIIKTLVKSGKTIISAENASVIAMALQTIEAGKTATFYVTKAQYDAVIRAHWTRERIEYAGMKPIPLEELQRIQKDLGIDTDGYSNYFNCPRCGTVYGMYEFLRQGIAEHGKAMVDAFSSLKDVAALRINPNQVPICGNCGLQMFMAASDPITHYYICRGYGCCSVLHRLAIVLRP